MAKSFYKQIALVIIAVTLFASCQKHSSFIQKELSGKVFVNDTILKPGVLVPVSEDIFLTESPNAPDYLYKVKSDAVGSFRFTYQPTSGEKYLYAKTNRDSVTYTGTIRTSEFEASKTLLLYPSVNYGIKVLVKDDHGNPINNVKVCAFTSSLLFNTNNCDLAIRNLTTNENGIVFFNATAPSRTFYILATLNSLSLRGTGVITSNSSGINMLEITLANINGFELNVVDDQAPPTPVDNAQIFGYRSRAVFLLDTNHTSSIFLLTSSINGKASMYNIDPVRYYLRAIKIVGIDTLQRLDSVDVSANAVSNKLIRLL